jgi:hypothetical protein
MFSLPKRCMYFSAAPYVPHVLPISSSSIWSPQYYLANSTNHAALYCVVTSILHSLPCSAKKYSPQHLVCVLPSLWDKSQRLKLQLYIYILFSIFLVINVGQWAGPSLPQMHKDLGKRRPKPI